MKNNRKLTLIIILLTFVLFIVGLSLGFIIEVYLLENNLPNDISTIQNNLNSTLEIQNEYNVNITNI